MSQNAGPGLLDNVDIVKLIEPPVISRVWIPSAWAGSGLASAHQITEKMASRACLDVIRLLPFRWSGDVPVGDDAPSG